MEKCKRHENQGGSVAVALVSNAGETTEESRRSFGECVKHYNIRPNCTTLPKEVCLIILEFCGMVKNRNGAYIGQISKTDVRYILLQTIPKPKDSLGGKVFTGCCIIELRVDIKKTIDNMKYDFCIVRVFSNDNLRKCYHMIEYIDKWRNGRRISKGQYEYV